MQLEEKNFSNVLCVTDSNNRTTESYWLKGTRGSNQKASLLKKTVLQKKNHCICYPLVDLLNPGCFHKEDILDSEH